MAQYDKLWNKWYSNKILNEMAPKIANRVVAVSDQIKQKAGLEGLNDSYTRMAAFPEIFGDKLRIVGEYSTSELNIMSKYLKELANLADASLEDKESKGFIKRPQVGGGAYFTYDLAKVTQTRRRLREQGGGEYEVSVEYYQPFLQYEYTQTANGAFKRETYSLLKAFNKFKMKEAAEYWDKIQSTATKDKNFITTLTTDWSLPEKKGKSSDQDKIIVYSRAPIDVLRMSDHPDISSCHSQGGGYFKCAIQEAVRGGAIAYSVKKDDLQKIIDEGRLQDIEIFADPERGIEGIVPDGRVRIRRMFDTDTKIEYALPEFKKYGNLPNSFGKSVLKWAVDNQRNKFMDIETKEFKLPKIENAIKVGGSYNDNISFELYNQLARGVAKSFGEELDKLDIEHFYIEDTTVNEGADLITDCERKAREIISVSMLPDAGSLIGIKDYKIYCKKDGKTGLYSSKEEFSVRGQGGLGEEEYNDEFDRIEIEYSVVLKFSYVKAKIISELNSDIIKQLIVKTEELSPYGNLYRIYKQFGLEKAEFEISNVDAYGNKLASSYGGGYGGGNTYNNQYSYIFATHVVAYTQIDQPYELNLMLRSAGSYQNYNNNLYEVIEAAGVELGVMEAQPFNTFFAKRLFADINKTDFMTYVRGQYGSYVTFRSPSNLNDKIDNSPIYSPLKQPRIEFPHYTDMEAARAAGDSVANVRSEIGDYFYFYRIPREAIRASMQLATKETHPNLKYYDIYDLNRDEKNKLRVLMSNLRSTCEEVARNMFKLFPTKIKGQIELLPYIHDAVISSKENDVLADAQIAFSLKVSLPSGLYAPEQLETLKTLQNLYENFDKFKDSLEKELIYQLRNSPYRDVKDLMSKYYLKGIEGDRPLAQSALDLNNEEVIKDIVSKVQDNVLETAKKEWIEYNGNYESYRKPFFSVLLEDKKTIRVYYTQCHSFKKVVPWDEKIFYADFQIIKLNNESEFLRFYCISPPESNKRYVASQASVITGNMNNIVDKLSSFIHIKGYQVVPTTLEEEKHLLSGYEEQMTFDIKAEKEAEQQKLMNLRGTVSNKPETQEKEPEQLGLFERKQRNKLIKERLLNWYKRNK